MKIKVQCPCGSRFEFEIEPVDGRMPVAVPCPTCGQDATQLANEVIHHQLTQTRAPVGPKLGLSTSGHPSEPAHPQPASPVSPSDAPASTSSEFCPRHLHELAADTCRVCGKPICHKCMEVFGYLCSSYCRTQALERNLAIPVCPLQKSVVAEKETRALKIGVAMVTAALVLVASLWIWYAWFAVMPKVAFSIKLSENSAEHSLYELVGPGQLLSLSGSQLAVYDIRAGRQLWSASLDSAVSIGLSHPATPDVVVSSNDVWVLLSDRLAHFDLKTGARKTDAPLKSPATSFSSDAQYLLAVSQPDSQPATLTRIALASGAVETQEAAGSPPTEKPGATPRPRNAASSPSAKLAERKPDARPENIGDQFIAAGPNAAQIKLNLIQPNVVYLDTMKPKGASALESSSLNASQGAEVAQEMLSDSQRQRTGGKRAVDLSRYRITLHRWFANDLPDWSAEVVGAPDFFPLHSVDLLVTDTLLQVFDKQNKKLWESKLTYRIPSRDQGEQRHLPNPCWESGNALYLADQGMLTSFDPATGSVHWRLTSVGISRVQFDEQGKLYIDTTTADPEFIQYPDDLDLRKRVHPVLLKVEPSSGQVLWRVERMGSNCLLSGKFVYAARTSIASALLHLGEGEKYDFNLYRLDPADGRELWRYYQPKPALRADAAKTWIMLQFPDELQVLRFYSL